MTVIVLGVVVVAVVAALGLLAGRHRRSAVARMHVDDLAVGAGPAVCAITGMPTDHWVGVSSSEGGFQAWWLVLVFFGPIGWIAIIVLAAVGRRSSRVSGVMPISPEALDRYNAAVSLSRRAIVAAALVVIGWVALAATSSGSLGTPVIVVAGAAGALAVVVWLGASIIAPFRWIDLELDGSGRWVTITRAHPDYAAALARHNAAVHVRRP